ncbi:MAG: thioesterase family protein [Acidimicrobiia bacterium]|nr:thioesterase family protein [Acidimicrobiia bacterium]
MTAAPTAPGASGSPGRYPLERETAVVPVEGGAFEGAFGTGWIGDRGPHGGFVAAVMLRAMREAVADPQRRPVFLTASYLEPPRAPAPYRVDVTVERQGRSVSVATARLVQEARPVALATATFSAARPRVEFRDPEMPDVPPPEECPPLDFGEIFGAWRRLPLNRRFEWRLAAGAPLAGGDRADTVGWARFVEPQPVDHLLGAVLADIWMPSVLARVREPVMAPTLQLSVWYCAPLPPPGADGGGDFVLCRFYSPVAAGGFVEEDGEVWSRDGQLLLRSRQLATLTAPLEGR